VTISALGDRVPSIDPTAWVHPDATIIGDVVIGPGSSIWPGAVLRGDFGSIRIGARTSVQDNAVIHSGPPVLTTVGSNCIVAHLAFIEMATVEDDCMVAVAAQMLPGAILRRGTVAAAGAVLARGLEVPTGYRAQGVPAEIVPSEHPDAAYIASGAAEYAAMAIRYAEEGIGAMGADLAPLLDSAAGEK
jgi:carbonic anhydrase/acetyltransferase-like protein (isoleucine patch superfamily)